MIPHLNVNSFADFDEPKKWKPGSKKRKSSHQIKKELSDVNEEQDDLDSTNNSPTEGKKIICKEIQRSEQKF